MLAANPKKKTSRKPPSPVHIPDCLPAQATATSSTPAKDNQYAWDFTQFTMHDDDFTL